MYSMEKLMVVALVSAAVLLYLIKPEPIQAGCVDWESSIFHKYIDINNRIETDPNPGEELAYEWMTLQRGIWDI